MGKRGPKKGSFKRPGKKSPYASKPIETLPLWYQDLVYEAATYNLSIRQLAVRLSKAPFTIWKVLKFKNVRDAIESEKKKLRAGREKQLATIDKTAINRVEHLLKTSRQPDLVANLAVKHLKGRGIYVEGEKIEHSGKIEVIIEKELVDKPAEKPGG